MQQFTRIESWIFDLDNTLYPAECNLFAQMDQRMGDFISNYLEVSFDAARRLQKDYYRIYGTTLAGLMVRHGLDPKEFLDYVHDIDFSVLPEAPELGEALDLLPGRKFIFTNGSREYAEKVASKLGILDRFADVFDIAATGYVPKPEPAAYQRFLKVHGVAAANAVMFEDMPHNLEAPYALGMVTVLVKSRYFANPVYRGIDAWETLPTHVHHLTDDLTGFLHQVVEARKTNVHKPPD
jgi:putative hydrolase of the HAD superfamily